MIEWASRAFGKTQNSFFMYTMITEFLFDIGTCSNLSKGLLDSRFV